MMLCMMTIQITWVSIDERFPKVEQNGKEDVEKVDAEQHHKRSLNLTLTNLKVKRTFFYQLCLLNVF